MGEELVFLEEVPVWHEEPIILNAIADAITVIRLDGTILQTNDAALTIPVGKEKEK